VKEIENDVTAIESVVDNEDSPGSTMTVPFISLKASVLRRLHQDDENPILPSPVDLWSDAAACPFSASLTLAKQCQTEFQPGLFLPPPHVVNETTGYIRGPHVSDQTRSPHGYPRAIDDRGTA